MSGLGPGASPTLTRTPASRREGNAHSVRLASIAALGTFYLVIVVVAAVAAIPLMFATKAGA